MTSMNIGDAARAAGVTPKMIRHYESLGLIAEVERTDAGYRLYTAREVGMLRFIRRSRALGFSMKQIESLLALWRDDGRESREVKELAERQLAELEERQRELDQMRATLSQLVAQCPGDHSSHCAILDRLATPVAGGEAAPDQSRPRKTLKEVRPGSHTTPRPRREPRSALRSAQPQGHAGLMAWSRGFAASSAA